MDTINNATTAVKNAIWGEGQQNTTTTTTTSTDNNYSTNNNNNTYDNNTYDDNTNDRNIPRSTNTNDGNLTSSSASTGSGMKETHKSMIDDSVTETREYSGRTESDPMAKDSYNAESARNQSAGQPSQAQGANFTNQQGTNSNPMSNSNEPNTGFGGSGAQPSVTADPNSAQQPTQKHQGADRPNEEPDSSSTRSGQSGNSGGMGGMKLPDNKSSEEGTGTKYVKTSGMAADGGDFDATKPGAAREADRLMEEKGIKHGDSNTGGVSGESEKEKKWFGVDHSGFGGHGSHSNKKPTSLSEPTGEGPETTEPTEHKGVGQKLKDKLHH